MNKGLLVSAILLSALLAGCGGGQMVIQRQSTDSMLVHNVFFTLKDTSDAAKKEFTDSCYKYLNDHPGVVFFAAGLMAEEINRAANVRNFHVAAHIVFRSKQYYDQYQTSEKHLQFMDENKDKVEMVRVYDTFIR